MGRRFNSGNLRSSRGWRGGWRSGGRGGRNFACVRRSHAIVRLQEREGVGRITEVGSRIKRANGHQHPPPPAHSYGETAGLKGSHLHYLSFLGGGVVFWCRPELGRSQPLKRCRLGMREIEMAVVGGRWNIHLLPTINGVGAGREECACTGGRQQKQKSFFLKVHFRSG